MAEPRPLILKLYTTYQRSGQLVALALAGTGVRAEDAPLYSVLDREGPLTPTEVSRRLGIGPSTLSYRLKVLEAEGEVVRRPNPADGRSALLELSPAGRRHWRRIVPSFTTALRKAERRVALPHQEVAASLDAIALAIDEELEALNGPRT